MPPSDGVASRPTLLHSCAMAATAAEAGYRIDNVAFTPRDSRIIALDEGASGIVARLTGQDWAGGHFLIFDATVSREGPGEPPTVLDAMLRTPDGALQLLSAELADADVVVMVATEDASAPAASVVGDACADHLIMSVGLVVSPSGDADQVVAALRPNAMVLVILREEAGVAPILTALRV